MKLVVKNITKADLAKHVEKELKCSRRISLRLINSIFHYIEQHLEDGNRVHLSPFGTFETRHRAAHRGKNPKTGETFHVKARRAVVFKPGRALKHFRPKG